jgi:hypothetical protein
MDEGKIKTKAWFIKFPGTFHALGPMRFDTPKNKQEVREQIREWEGGRLPRGFKCWPAE